MYGRKIFNSNRTDIDGVCNSQNYRWSGVIILKKDIIKEYIDKLYIEFEKNTMDEICNMIFEIRAELRNSYDDLKTEDNCLIADMIIKVMDSIDLSKTKLYELREKITCIRELFNLINWEEC